MAIGDRGLYGQPTRPYIDFRSYAGSDIFVDMTFLDANGAERIPAQIIYQVDDLSNAINMIQQTSVAPTGPRQTVQIPGVSLPMTYPWQGSQLCQIWIQAVITDSVTGLASIINAVAICELCAIQYPTYTGQF